MVKNNKLIVVFSSVIILLILFIFMQNFLFKPGLVETKKELLCGIVLQKVDLSPTKMYPWQKYFDVEVWGREGFYMPNVYTAVDSKGFPTRVTDQSEAVKPLYYFRAPLQDINQPGTSYSYYIVIDENGYLWLDEDGTFHDSRFTKRMRNDSVVVNTKKVDDIDTNNTLGPFLIKELKTIYGDTIQIHGQEVDLPYEQDYFILEYLTVNNDVVGIYNTDKSDDLNAFVEEAFSKKVDSNILLLVEICEYIIR